MESKLFAKWISNSCFSLIYYQTHVWQVNSAHVQKQCDGSQSLAMIQSTHAALHTWKGILCIGLMHMGKENSAEH